MLSTLLTLSTRFTFTNSIILALLFSEDLCNWSILHFVYLFVFLCTSQLLSLNDHCSIVSTKWHDKCQPVRVRILRPGLLLPGSIPGRVGLPRFVPGCSPKPTGSCTRVVSHWPITGRSRAAGPTDQPERSQRGFLLGRLQAWYCPSPYHDILGHDFLFKEHDILTS